MSINEHFLSTSKISYGRVCIDQASGLLSVGATDIGLNDKQARIVAMLLANCLSGEGISAKSASQCLGYDTEDDFKKEFAVLKFELKSHIIANFGGADSYDENKGLSTASFYETSIMASDLFSSDRDEYKLNKKLAILITDKPFISEADLNGIKYAPQHYGHYGPPLAVLAK